MAACAISEKAKTVNCTKKGVSRKNRQVNCTGKTGIG